MNLLVTSAVLAKSIAALLFASALLRLLGGKRVRGMFGAVGVSPDSTRVIGVMEAIAAAFLIEPITRIWGVALAAMVITIVIVMLLERRRYIWTIPGVLTLAALAPASLSALY